jgi:hypothetical protein
MQKVIRIVAIIAVILVALSLLLLLATIPFQQSLGRLWSTSDDVLALLPIFPLAQFVPCFMLLGCAILAVVFGGNKKGGIWLEILVFAAVALALPVMRGLLSYVQTVAIGHYRGSVYLVANATAAQIASYCMWPANLGNSLVLVVCGMSIVFKRMSQKLESGTNA